jgi:hypothetical protein
MRLHSDRSRKEPSFSKPVPCAQCGHGLSSPAWSEEIGAARVRYLWSCHACGYEFETTVFLSVPEAA